MNIKSLRTLVEIDRIGSFAAVADRLGMTLSAVSVQMKTLEEELRTPLFDRTRRPPAMTPAAREAARRARAILTEIDALRGVGETSGALRGVFRVGFVGTASVRLLPGFLTGAAETHPNAEFLVESGLSSDLIGGLLAGRLDAAVITQTPDAPRGLRLVTLAEEPLALAAPARAAGWPLSRCAEALGFIKFLPSSGIGVLVDAHIAEHARGARERVTVDSVEAVMGCVNAGVGFAVIPEPDARRYAEPGRAVVAPLTDPPLTRRLALAVVETGPIAAHVEALAALIRSADPSRAPS